MRILISVLFAIACFKLFSAQPPPVPFLTWRLHKAIEDNDIERMQSLLVLNVDVNELYLGRTALETAVCCKKPDIIGCLIDHRAHVSADIVFRFLKSGHMNYTIEEAFDSLQLLLNAGAIVASLEQIPRGYLAPVMLAHGDSDAIHTKVVEMLSAAGKHKIA